MELAIIVEYRTQILTTGQIAKEIDHIVSFLQKAGKHEIEIYFGWGCDLDQDALYQSQYMPTAKLSIFIEQSILSGAVVLGNGDVFIKSTDDEMNFVLAMGRIYTSRQKISN